MAAIKSGVDEYDSRMDIVSFGYSNYLLR